MLKAYTGLEGGLVASGSTCGVVTGGAAGIALMHLDALSQAGAVAEFRILPLVQDYMHWFEKHYGSCLCRYRTGVDFHTPAGQTRYFLPGDKTAGCLLHIRGAVRYISELRNRPLPDSDQTAGADLGRATHCAATVLEKIAERTGLSDDTLSRIAFVFDGGVGLSGGVCGALTGAILGINLKLGMDIRNMGYLRTIQDFIAGHLNLLREKPPAKAEPFSVGNTVVRRFREDAGNIECAAITGKTFCDYPDFHQYIGTSRSCRELMDKAAAYAVAAINAC